MRASSSVAPLVALLGALLLHTSSARYTLSGSVYSSGNGQHCNANANIKCTSPYAGQRVYWCDSSPGCGSVSGTAFCNSGAQNCRLVDVSYLWNCWEGHELIINQCTQCSTGQYRAGSGSSITTVFNSAACEQCPAGSYMDETGGILCKACPTGRYSAACAAGHPNADQAAPLHPGCISCTVCGSGKYADQTGLETCKSCPAGYQARVPSVASSVANSCKLCPAGYNTNGATGVSSGGCSACPVGRFRLATDTSDTCSACPAGYIAASAGQGSCAQCAPDQFTQADGNGLFTACTDCATGTVPNAGNNGCDACTSGQYADKATGVCTSCEAGKYQPGNSQGSCIICPAGYADDSGSTTQCAQCALGKFRGQETGPAFTSSCADCASGFAAESQGSSACSECAAGQHATSDHQRCQACPAGYAAPTVQTQGACTGCETGRFQDQSGQTTCKSCDQEANPSVKYQDQVAQGSCKTCGADFPVATADHRGCTNCTADQYFNGNTGSCSDCEGCSSGSYRDGCQQTSPGSCVPCAQGTFKSVSFGGGSAWNLVCTACAGCPAGTERPVGDVCRSTGATTDPAPSGCVACPAGRFHAGGAGRLWDDDCQACATCPQGASRSNCAGANAGTCSQWPAPTVTQVEGSGQTGGSTTGNEPLIIYGTNFGPVDSARTDVQAVYGPAAAVNAWNPGDPLGAGMYQAAGCQVVALQGAAPLGTGGIVQCLTVAGFGADYHLKIVIGESTFVQASATFAADIDYGRPIVARYEPVSQTSALITSGNQQFTVFGANFGPPGTAVDAATYGASGEYAATCALVIDHDQLSCTTAPGAGIDHKLVITIGGQFSTTPSVSYGVPQVRDLACGTQGQIDSTTQLPACSCSTCMGVAASSMVPAVTIGNLSAPCLPPACARPQAMASDLDSNAVRAINTKGFQRITITGVNLGAGVTTPSTPHRLEKVEFGPDPLSTVSIPIVTGALPNDAAACHVPDTAARGLQIVCGMPSGIGTDLHFFITVDGQKSAIWSQSDCTNDPERCRVTFSYRSPSINSVTPQTFRTSGSTTPAILRGQNMGTDASAASLLRYTVQLFQHDSSSNPCDGTPSFEVDNVGGLQVLAPESDGTERISFNVPAGYVSYDVRLKILHQQTGQTVYSQCLSNSIGYLDPVITSVDPPAGSDQPFIRVYGDNFCAEPGTPGRPACGQVFVCDAPCFTSPGVPRVTPEVDITTLNGAFVGSYNSYTHTQIILNSPQADRHLYVRVGPPGGPYRYSNSYSFASDVPIIKFGGSFTQYDGQNTGILRSPTTYRTSALDDNGNDIIMTVRVSGIEGAGKDILSIQVGPASNLIPLHGDPAPSSDGNITVLQFKLPPWAGSNVPVSVRRGSDLQSQDVFISYLPPTISTVLKFPFAQTDVLRTTAQAGGGIPTGGVAAQSDAASQAAAVQARDNAQVTVDSTNATMLARRSELEDAETAYNAADNVNQTVAFNDTATEQEKQDADQDAAQKQALFNARSADYLTALRAFNDAVLALQYAEAAISYNRQTLAIVGENFGLDSFTGVAFQLKWSNHNATVASAILTPTERDHTRLVVEAPDGEGFGWFFDVLVAGHNRIIYPPIPPESLKYHAPIISSVSPSVGATAGGYNLTIAGSNMGLTPTVTIGGESCPVIDHTHDYVVCTVPAGEGSGLDVVVTADEISSTSANAFRYQAPVLASLSPATGRTDGLSTTGGNRVVATIQGTNFGRTRASGRNRGVRVLFTTQSESPQRTFTVAGGDIVDHDGTSIRFYLPRGFGASVTVQVEIGGQLSANSQSFSYDGPVVDDVQPFCGGRDVATNQWITSTGNLTFECYGYTQPGLKYSWQYPKIDRIDVTNAGSATVSYTEQLQTGAHLNTLAPSDVVQISGMGNRYLNGTHRVVSVGTSSFTIQLGVSANISAGAYTAANGRIALSYRRANSGNFQLFETDGCSAEYLVGGGTGVRYSGWEAYSTYVQRQAFSTEPIERECASRSVNKEQRIRFQGTNLASAASASRLRVIAERKVCDCENQLDGVDRPCLDFATKTCYPAGDGGTCATTYRDCRSDGEYAAAVELPVEDHSDTFVYVKSPKGYGRNLRLTLSVGARNATIPAAERIFRFQPPVVRLFDSAEVGAARVFRPGSEDRAGSSIAILGFNMGFGTQEEVQQLIQVRIGSEYDAAGNDCRDTTACNLDDTMLLCPNLVWHRAYTSGTQSSQYGFPYITASIPNLVAGYHNISVTIAGQTDDCSTNPILCADPANWPVDRRPREYSNFDFGAAITNPTSGPLFTCARSTEDNQAYAGLGEKCVQINKALGQATCGDTECTVPRALSGFWRLDLDLAFACTDNTATPCQEEVQVQKLDIKDAVSGFFGSGTNTGSGQLCVAALPQPANSTERPSCASNLLQCSNRGSTAPGPGACAFRRPKEVTRAMGKDFEPWDNSDYVKSLEPRCNKVRYAHLIDSSVYGSSPGLQQSETCYDIVACSPKTSCTGDNTCAAGYEYNRYRCLKWNEENPDKLTCSSDLDCRSRSGANDNAAKGLASACDLKHPEDCSRCVIAPGATQGTCECAGGAPRCGLCTQPADFNGTRIKGYFRLNNECQECPENPILILIAIVFAIVVFCAGGWWLQTKKINMSIISIGVDYFQVLAIFARIRVRWPSWVKQVLQVLSLFNFNIDIAAPECAVPEFDYGTKWAITMLLPLIFGGVLVLIFLGVALMKFIRKVTNTSTKAVKYCSHANKLVGMFLIVFYFLYLSLTRRALDIFNCNPVEPDDGYLYTEFTSVDCEAGLCRCNDPSELQENLKAPAALAVTFYSIGFPAFVLYITWFYRVQMKLDQILRAYGMGDTRAQSIDDFQFEERKFRSRSKRTYEVRKKFHQLYYHFKPGKVYWMLVILLRKFAIATIALLFRRNVAFMLSFILMVLFFSYVAQVKHRPYMSTVERETVISEHRHKVRQCLDAINSGAKTDEIDSDLYLHYNMDKAIEALLANLERTGHAGHGELLSLDDVKGKSKKRRHTYYFDYNTVEQVLIACGIFLSLIAIMFESGQFYVVDPETGLETLSTEAADTGFYTTILVAGALVLFGSITYYLVVFAAEVVGTLPAFLAACFAKKHRHLQKQQSQQDEALEMVQNPKFQNAGAHNAVAVAQLEEARKVREEAKAYAQETAQLEAAQNALASEVQRLRAQNQRQKLEGRTTPSRGRTRKHKPEFAQEALGDDGGASATSWTRMKADEDGVYYVNDATGQTSWELPRGHTAHD